MMPWAGATGSLPRSRYLMPAEIQRLLEGVDRVTRPQTRAKFRTLFLLLVNFGPRISEALAVRACDVDLETGAITFPTFKRWSRDTHGRRYRVPLSRTLPLAPELLSHLALYLQIEGFHPRDLLFPKPWRKYAWVVFKRALRAAGLSSHYRLHDLRHSAGTYLADKTRDPALVRDVLGHADLSTSSIYIHTVQLREKLLAVPPLLHASATSAVQRTPPWPR